MTDEEKVVDDAVAAMLTYARTTERTHAALTTAGSLVTALGSISELDPEVAPEVAAALSKVEEVADALGRLGLFLDARLETAMANAKRRAGL